MSKIITISGNIGTGKTTLLYNLFKNIPEIYIFDENAEKNMYLADYFGDMQRWAYHSRVAFLQQKLEDYLEIKRNKSSSIFVFDRGFDELQVFAAHLNKVGILNNRDFGSYMNLAKTVSGFIRASDLIIYLHCSPEKSLERIRARGNIYEKDISIEYIRQLHESYEKWIRNYSNVLSIDTEKKYNIDSIIDYIRHYCFGVSLNE